MSSVDLLKAAVRVLGSFGLAIALLFLLLVLTYFGTLAQAERSLYDVQRDYFESVYLIEKVGPIPLVLPGAYLLLTVLLVNLVVGGILRMRKGKATIGVLIAHLGIVLLLVGSFVEHQFSDKGFIRLFEEDTVDEFRSHHEWEVAVVERLPGGRVREHVIPQREFEDLEGSRTRNFVAEGLPFDVTLSGYARNAQPQAIGGGRGIDGVVLQVLEPVGDTDMANVPGIVVGVAGTARRAVLWGLQAQPWGVAIDGRRFEVDLRRRSWPLGGTENGFAVRLESFERKLHPGTGMAKEFSSYVVRIEGATAQRVHITMNEPMRHRGYTFYQSSWGPQDGRGEVWSQLSVVRNPSDQVPLIACIVIAIGLLIHFGRKLLLHVRAATRRSRAAAAALVTAALLLCATDAAWATEATPTPAPWPEDVLDTLATVPVQEGGRIKPLQTWSGYTLLRLNHRRQVTDPHGRTLGPMAWLLDVLLRPELAKHTPCFLIQDAEVLDAVGLAQPTGKKKRDRYTYEELAPARDRIRDLGMQYAHKDKKARTLVETYVMELAHDLHTYDQLLGYLDFAGDAEDPIRVGPALAELFPGRTRVSVVAFLEHAPAVARAARAQGAAEAENADDLTTTLQDVSRVLGRANALALFPPPTDDDTSKWLTPYDIAVRAMLGGTPVEAEHRAMLAALTTMARHPEDASRMQEAADAFAEASRRLADARGEYEKVELEVALTRLDPFGRALVLYLAAFLLTAFSWLWPNRWLVRGAVALLVVGLLIHLTGIGMRCVLRERPPVSTLYETVLFITASCVVACLVIERINRERIALAIAPILGALGLFVASRYEVLKGEDTMPKLVAVLDTNFWLTVHVLCITLGYAGGLLASAIAHVHVLGRLFGLKRGDAEFYRSLGRMVYGTLCFALIFSVVGTILGGIWANESWGRFWGWDPKENGALMIVLSQLIILHARMGGYIKAFGIAMASIASGVIVAFSWWGVNLLGIGLHSYGHTTGIAESLRLFYWIEGGVLAAGGVWWWIRGRGNG